MLGNSQPLSKLTDADRAITLQEEAESDEENLLLEDLEMPSLSKAPVQWQ